MRKGLILGAAVIFIAAMAMIWSRQTTSTSRPGVIDASLEGMVSSEEEGQMEGVLVRAKGIGSSIRITVVTDSQGHYAFPKTKLGAGKYSVSVRAVGYTIQDPGQIEVSENRTTRLDLKLTRTQDLTAQLTNAEWLMSLPGTDQEKGRIVCVNCHSMELTGNTDYSDNEWIEVLSRMSTYALASSPFGAVKLPYDTVAGTDPERFRETAKYLSRIISSSTRRELTFKTLPRPTGRSTKVIITEYDIPRRNAQPHDAVVDRDGMVWYADFALPYLGKLNPRTGEVVEYEMPLLKSGFPRGGNGIAFDKEGNVWIALMHQGAVVKFDKRTQKFATWSPSGKYDNKYGRVAHLGLNYLRNGREKLIVWFTDNTMQLAHKLDPETGQVDSYELYEGFPGGRELEGTKGIVTKPGHSIYGIAADSLGNGYFADLAGSNIGKVDFNTGKVTLYPTPTPNSAPKRIYMDAQDRLWFGGERANRIGVFDTKTEKFQEWATPTPWTRPYDVVLDKNGEVWTGGMTNDRIVRLNPKTNEFTDYLLPSSTNVRRVNVDNSTTPVTFWVGSNHAAMIVKLEPLD